MRTREFPESNYRSIFINGKTIRIAIDADKPITELRFPEFLDIAFGDKCVSGGNGRRDKNSACYYCYASAHAGGSHYKNIPDKINSYFGILDKNQLPYQVAIGGSQEPLEHPQFWDGVKAFKDLGIVPNYTTNGVFINQKAVDKTLEFCGGVAVTLHPHLEKYWRRALDLFIKDKVKLNVHYIVSDRASIDKLKELYQEYLGRVDYFVLLPYMNVGFAAGENAKTIDYAHFTEWLDTVFSYSNIAFGANFYEYLQDKQRWKMSLYPPEILSKYLVMNDNMELFSDSFKMIPCRDHVKEL